MCTYSPLPWNLPSSHCPTYLPSKYVIVPDPVMASSSQSPWYVRPSAYTILPLPSRSSATPSFSGPVYTSPLSYTMYAADTGPSGTSLLYTTSMWLPFGHWKYDGPMRLPSLNVPR